MSEMYDILNFVHITSILAISEDKFIAIFKCHHIVEWKCI